MQDDFLILRYCILQWLASFANIEWQKAEWFNNQGQNLYYSKVEDAKNFFLKAIDLEKSSVQYVVTNEEFAKAFYNTEELEHTYDFCLAIISIYSMIKNNNRDYIEIIESQEIYDLTSVAKKALNSFLKNEDFDEQHIAKW